jgi:hypothetical protein
VRGELKREIVEEGDEEGICEFGNGGGSKAVEGTAEGEKGVVEEGKDDGKGTEAAVGSGEEDGKGVVVMG